MRPGWPDCPACGLEATVFAIVGFGCPGGHTWRA